MAPRGTQRHSDSITGTQMQSEAITGTQQHSVALSGTQRAPGPETATMTQIASAISGGAIARHVCCTIVVRTSPSLSPLSTLAPPALCVPAPQDGETPADRATKYNGNAAVKAFFASGQVRPIRVQSEVTQRSSDGTQRASEGSQRPVSGTQRPSEAIRGHSEALRGTHRPSEGSQRPSLAIIRNQQHSGALGGNQEGAGTQDGHDGHIAC